MNLPLSQADKDEISEAYEKATTAIKASAISLEALIEVLEQKMACLDPASRKALSESSTAVDSGLFKLNVLRFRLKNANFEGREFSTFSGTGSIAS